MNASLLSSSIKAWSEEAYFEFRLSYRAEPDGFDPVLTEALLHDAEFRQAMVDLASSHPDAKVCAYALLAIADARTPAWLEIVRKFRNDPRELLFHQADFCIQSSLGETSISIECLQEVRDIRIAEAAERARSQASK